MTTADAVEASHTLRTAVLRADELRGREALDDPPLSQQEALELLALGEVIGRKIRYGQQLTVRSARAAGASWAQIGAALGTTRQSAWEAHSSWLAAQDQSGGPAAR